MNSCDVVSPADFQEGGKQCFWERIEATLRELQEAGQKYDSESIVGNTIEDMYAKCGMLVEKKEVFDDLLIQDVVSWSALISGYACQGDFLQVFHHLFEKTREDKIHPDKVLFLRLLSSCSHASLVESGYIYFGNSCKDYNITTTIEHVNYMIMLFIHAGQLDESIAITLRIPCVPDIVTWTTMLGVFQSGLSWTLDNKHSTALRTTLIDTHVKLASLAKAHSVVDKLMVWGVICGTTKLELDRKAIKCFKKMKWEVEVFIAIAVMFCLKACSSVSDVDKGQEIHMELVEEGFDNGYLVGSALASGYAKCVFTVEAHGVFDELDTPKVNSGTTLLASHPLHGHAYSMTRAIGKRKVHEGELHGLLKQDPILGNTWVDVWAKSGLFVRANDNIGAKGRGLPAQSQYQDKEFPANFEDQESSQELNYQAHWKMTEMDWEDKIGRKVVRVKERRPDKAKKSSSGLFRQCGEFMNMFTKIKIELNKRHSRLSQCNIRLRRDARVIRLHIARAKIKAWLNIVFVTKGENNWLNLMVAKGRRHQDEIMSKEYQSKASGQVKSPVKLRDQKKMEVPEEEKGAKRQCLGWASWIEPYTQVYHDNQVRRRDWKGMVPWEAPQAKGESSKSSKLIQHQKCPNESELKWKYKMLWKGQIISQVWLDNQKGKLVKDDNLVMPHLEETIQKTQVLSVVLSVHRLKDSHDVGNTEPDHQFEWMTDDESRDEWLQEAVARPDFTDLELLNGPRRARKRPRRPRPRKSRRARARTRFKTKSSFGFSSKSECSDSAM
ncbi:hypothetical protein L7F22_008274 [Adiantum nelumboides]|nr:hypothetical protein [Adiantum nelumboides]